MSGNEQNNHISILSFDCGQINLGICFLTYNKEWKNQIERLEKEFKKETYYPNQIKILLEMNRVLDTAYDIKILRTADLLGDRKMKEIDQVEKGILFKRYLTKLDEGIKQIGKIDQVLIEYQMNSNYESFGTSVRLISHYCDDYPIHIIGPSLKNKLRFHPKLDHREFLKKYNTNTKANKEHTKANLNYFLRITAQQKKLECVGKKDDSADAFMQALAFLKDKY